MVRLQKIAYEKIVNNAMVGRARQLSTPTKWYSANPWDQNRYKTYLWKQTYIGKLITPFLTWYRIKQLHYQQDKMYQQGLSWEDKYLHHDVELRRCNLFEAIARQTLHPYHWVLKKRKRDRYFKVQRAVKGFFVPEYVRQQAKGQSYSEFQILENEWQNHIHNNYWSDMTPQAHSSVQPMLIPLQFVVFKGIFKHEAWNRYFFQQRDQNNAPKQEVSIVHNPKVYPWDLTNAQGKRKFEEWFAVFDKKHPGFLTRQGQTMDFQKYYQSIGV